jgi:hypothetical protein
MVVLPSTGASRYHNYCIDGGTSLENFGYLLVGFSGKKDVIKSKIYTSS